MKINSVRQYALSLEAVTEEPHHNNASFRVRGKIFLTVPPEEDFLHVFVGEEDRQEALAMYPEFIETLLWGTKVLGLRVALASAPPAVVRSLVSKAYETRVLKDAGPSTSSSRPRKSKKSVSPVKSRTAA